MYSARVNYDLSCPMNFKDYPVDEQVCDIEFESWGHTNDQLIFQWHNVDPIKVNQNISLNQHVFQVGTTTKGGHNYSTGSYSSVTVRLHLTRKLTYHLLRTYLPSILFVMVAWFSMFVPLNHVPGRVTMSMTTMLTLSSMFNALTNITPPISYTTKLDIWMICCISFIWGTLLEFTVVIFLKYYLRHLPTFQFSRENSRAVSKAQIGKQPVFDVKTHVNSWLKNESQSRDNLVRVLKIKARQENQENLDTDTDDSGSESEDEQEGIKTRNEASEKIIKNIEKWSVILYLITLLLFMAFYWWDLLKNYNPPDENDHYKPMKLQK